MEELFENSPIDVDKFVDPAIDWMSENLRPFFQALKVPVGFALDGIESALTGMPPELTLCLLFLLAWQIAGVRVAIWSVLGLVAIGLLGAWQDAMVTLGLVTTAVLFSVCIGVPIGIVIAKSSLLFRIARPVLDTMQTLPAFVYLIPIVMMFGIGNVPGVIVTIIYAIPPVIRLTALGIRSVPPDLREAADAFGSTGWQILMRVELPLALPTVMAGVNQTIMMALGMVVYASMIAVKGLGLLVLRGIGSLDMGIAVVGGFGIVILAMMLDRLSENAARSVDSGRAHRFTRPSDIVGRLIRRTTLGPTPTGA